MTQNRDWKWLLWVGKSLESAPKILYSPIHQHCRCGWLIGFHQPLTPAFLNCLLEWTSRCHYNSPLLEYNVLLKQISTAPFHPRVLWNLSISWVVLKLDHIWSCWMCLFQVNDSLFMSFSDFACFSLNRTSIRHHDHRTPPLPVIPPSPACLRRILALSCTASAAISAKHRARGLCEGTCQG